MSKNNKTEIIILRCTKTEKKIIVQFANQSGLSISEYCRTQAKNGEIYAVPKLNKSEIEYFHLLKSTATNFNRISNLIRAKDPDLVQEIRLLVDHFNELQKRLIG